MESATTTCAHLAPLPFALAKAEYLAATDRMNEAARADDKAQKEYSVLLPNRPEKTIEFDHPGFTVNSVTLAPHRVREELKPYHVHDAENAKFFADHPGYLAYRDELRAWVAAGDAAAQRVGLAATGRTWEAALDAQMIAWGVLSESIPASLAEFADKLDLCRADGVIKDASGNEQVGPFLATLARDLHALMAGAADAAPHVVTAEV